MKKTFKILIIVIMVLTLSLALVSCDNTLNKAYEQAVQEGFVGTQTEWLASLTAGKSAYEIAVENGYSGTEAEWLASLKGKDGKNGKEGIDGANGANGLNGIDGKNGATVQELYDFACSEGYQGDFWDFLKEFFDINITNNTIVATNMALRSAVSVYCKFTVQNHLGESVSSQSAGSGIIYTLDKENGNAYFITNYHVVYDSNSTTENHIAEDIKIFLYGMEYLDNPNTPEQELDYGIIVEYVGGCMTNDIAVLKVENSEILKNSDALAVTIADSNDISVGSAAIAVGNPEGIGISATSGIVSVDSENIVIDNKSDINYRVMRIDTAINSGNSGGGLFNSDGKLIGIVNAKLSSSTIDNIGYAIPSNIAIYTAQNIIDNQKGQLEKCMLGITVQIVESKSIYDKNTLTTKIIETIKVYNIDENGVSFGSELKVGDILKKIKIKGVEYEITRIFVVPDLMLTCRLNETVVLTVERNVEGDIITKEISIGLTAKSIQIIP